MKRKKLLTLFGSICLVLVLVALLLPACAKEVPTPAPPTPPTPAPPTPAPPAPAPKPAPEPIKLIFSAAYVPSYALSEIVVQPWMDYIEKESGGQVTFEVYWANALVGKKDHYKATQAGTCDICFTSNAWAPEIPNICSDCIPSRYPSMATKVMLTNDLHREFQNLYHDTGVHMLNVVISSGYDIWSKGFAVKTAEDFKGKKVRGGGRLAMPTQALGGIPVSVTTSEATIALEKGTIEISPMGPAAALSIGLHEVATHITTATNYWYGHGHLDINLAKWNSLPQDIKDIITKASDLAVEWNIEGFRKEDAKAMETFKQTPTLEIYELPKDELQRWCDIIIPVVKPIYTEDMKKAGLPSDELWAAEARYFKKYKHLR